MSHMTCHSSSPRIWALDLRVRAQPGRTLLGGMGDRKARSTARYTARYTQTSQDTHTHTEVISNLPHFYILFQSLQEWSTLFSALKHTAITLPLRLPLHFCNPTRPRVPILLRYPSRPRNCNVLGLPIPLYPRTPGSLELRPRKSGRCDRWRSILWKLHGPARPLP
jgi:hypothetical protein